MRSDLKLPDQVFAALSIFLMLSIGLQGGAKLADRPLAELALPMPQLSPRTTVRCRP